jgi:hypothetical protein
MARTIPDPDGVHSRLIKTAGAIPLGQKNEAAKRSAIVRVRRSFGRWWTNYTLKKRRILR